eukprot:TRINITY_DN1557_c1_g1_i1.p1 TRINITY_DN1557_c1_g1~~TRINITY_DN1557_c1_g1_i1.p1  ORF type:complete len:376 (+),score=73.07 TRINITY_DN1557_c1_g1_i1:70-1197(+)
MLIAKRVLLPAFIHGGFAKSVLPLSLNGKNCFARFLAMSPTLPSTPPPGKKTLKKMPSLKRARAADSTPPAKKSAKTTTTAGIPVDDLMKGTVHKQADGVKSYQGNDTADHFNIISWNVNGLRAVIKKFAVFDEMAKKEKPHVICLQEIKLDETEAIKIPTVIKGYQTVWNPCTVKKGYSGTALLIREDIFNKTTITTSILGGGFNDEGRIQVVEFEDKDFLLINTYVPNAGADLKRLEYRTKEWDVALRNYMKREVDNGKSVILTGDLNVAHLDVDIHNPKGNQKSAGFTPQERNSFSELLETGFSDTFRELHPTKTGFYTYFSYRSNGRAKNMGWRLDYFIVNDSLMDKVVASSILSAYEGSDHVPVQLLLKN